MVEVERADARERHLSGRARRASTPRRVRAVMSTESDGARRAAWEEHVRRAGAVLFERLRAEATRAAEAPLHEISADAILQSRSLASRKSERRVQVRSTCTPGYTKFDFSRLITIRKRSPRRGESGWKGSCRCVQRLDLNAQASRLCASRALRLARSGCTQRRPECETRRRATLRVYTREAWGPPRAGLRA